MYPVYCGFDPAHVTSIKKIEMGRIKQTTLEDFSHFQGFWWKFIHGNIPGKACGVRGKIVQGPGNPDPFRVVRAWYIGVMNDQRKAFCIFRDFFPILNQERYPLLHRYIEQEFPARCQMHRI